MREKIGKFKIVRLLGQGAMGEVYLARDTALDREVAVKTIRLGTSFGSEATARFEREARAAGSLNHPNVVTVFEFGEDDGVYFLAMEYIEGEDLEALIRRQALLMPELLALLAQACEGLAYAHERGVVHRDIKPANILVGRSGKRRVAKLMDFGLAVVGHSDLTQEGNWMGTVNYMAPEYLDTGKAGPASDIFAMGVILYEILSGGLRPFTGENATAVLSAILRKEPARLPLERMQNFPADLMDVANRALAKQPGDRYPSADALAEAIRRVCADQTIPPMSRDETFRPAHGEPAAPLQPAPAGAGLVSPGSGATPGSGSLLVVGRGGRGQCMSVRVALRQAEPGTRILVLPGIYRESLVVDKDVAIIGQGGPGEVVIESAKGPCLNLQASGARLSNLQLQTLAGEPGPAMVIGQGRPLVENCGIDAQDGPAVRIAGPGADPVLVDCTIRSAGGCGIELGAQAGARLEDCLLEAEGGAGLRVGPGAQAVAARCRIQNRSGVGVALDPGARVTLEECQISGQQAGGVEVEADARAELKRCQVSGSGSVGVLVLERGQASLEDCDLDGHAAAGAHGVAGATLQLQGCRLSGNLGLGASIAGEGLLTLDQCALRENGEAAVLVQQGATVRMHGCQIFDGRAYGVVCARQGRGVLESCEIYGNAKTGAKVEAGGSLLLVRCDLRDGRDTGILLFEDAEVTLEECVVHRNARGGILLAKDASDPILRGGNKIQDALLRTQGEGAVVKVAPVK
jgi:hypothetical protein